MKVVSGEKIDKKTCWNDIKGGQCFIKRACLYICLKNDDLMVFNFETEKVVDPIVEYDWDDEEEDCYIVDAKVIYC